VQTSLIASVVSTWLSLQTNNELLALTQRTLATRQDSLRLNRMRFEQGVTSALDLRQAESLTAAAQATLAQQRRLRALDVNALTQLVGQPLPETLLAAPAIPAAQSLHDVPVGMPSDLLERRPDIRQAEQMLIGANANIGAARAAFFPRIALTAQVGSVSSELSGLFKSGSWAFSLAPQLALPIFDAGRNQAGLEAAQAGRQIAVAQYEKSIQVAFREVSDALAGQATLQQQSEAQRAQVQADSKRLQLSDLRYRNGVASYLDLLDAQRSLFATEQALVLTRLQQLQNQVTLYKVLGGGWTEATAATRS
jgi:multidrug efflux system outer membrane protein